jgi:hypothetical protein
VLKETVGQGTFTVVDVGYDTEIADVLHKKFRGAKVRIYRGITLILNVKVSPISGRATAMI